MTLDHISYLLTRPRTWLVIFIVLWFIHSIIKKIVSLTPHDIHWLKKSALAIFSVMVLVCMLLEIWVAIAFAMLGAGYEMVKMKAPKRCCTVVKVYALLLTVLLTIAQVLDFAPDQYEDLHLILVGLCAIFMVGYMTLVKVYCNRYRNIINGPEPPVDMNTHKYVHPCQGQCVNPEVILHKSPTPRYQHNCRAPCATATRSGRYYRGKQRTRTW